MVVRNDNECLQRLDSLKARVEFYRKGSIVPQRVLNSDRRKKHLVTFGSNCWLVPTKSGYLVLVDCGENGSALRLGRNIRNARLQGSPYSSGGTLWLGNARMSAEEYSLLVMRELAKLNLK